MLYYLEVFLFINPRGVIHEDRTQGDLNPGVVIAVPCKLVVITARTQCDYNGTSYKHTVVIAIERTDVGDSQNEWREYFSAHIGTYRDIGRRYVHSLRADKYNVKYNKLDEPPTRVDLINYVYNVYHVRIAS